MKQEKTDFFPSPKRYNVRYHQDHVLLIEEKYYPLIERGVKTTTIRRGIREVKPNTRLKLQSNKREFLGEICVKSVIFKKVNQLTFEDAKHDGFNSKAELLKALYTIYPDISENEQVSIINFEFLCK